MLTADANAISGATAVGPNFPIPCSAFASRARDPIIKATPAIFASAPRPLFSLNVPLAARSPALPVFLNVSDAPSSGVSQLETFLYALNAIANAIAAVAAFVAPSACLFKNFNIPPSTVPTPDATFFKTLNAGVRPAIMPFKLIFSIPLANLSKTAMIFSFALFADSAIVGKPLFCSILSMAPIQVAIPFVTPVPRLVNAVLMPPVALLAWSSNDARPSIPSSFSLTMVSMNSSIDTVPLRKPSPSASVDIPIAFAT